MKKNNLILGAFLVITAVLFSGCGVSSSSDSTSTEKVEGSNESTESGGVVTIGSQVWTSKNLDVATYRNGDVIPQVQEKKDWRNLTTGAWCYRYNDASEGKILGKLYNWYAVNDPRGLAPEGFHIPSDSEWTILIDYLGGEGKADEKMQSTWGWENNFNGTNSSGFSGLPGGCRLYDGSSFWGGRSEGFWWSSTERKRDKYNPTEDYAFYRGFEAVHGLQEGKKHKGSGFSVRCVRDTYITDNENLFITDNENLFTNQQITVLDKIISDFEKATSNEIAIVTNESIGDFTNIKEYSVSLANKMGVGKKNKNNGILFVISKKRREIFIATGIETEKILTNSKCQEIISETIIPYLKKNEYYLGVKVGLEESIKKWTVGMNPNNQGK